VTAATLWLAALVPALLAINLPPSATLLNQAAAWAGWGLVATYGMRGVQLPLLAALAPVRLLVAALALLVLATLASGVDALPMALTVSTAGTLGAAALAALLGVAMASQQRWPGAWFGAWLALGIASSVIGCAQVFAPSWLDGEWIALSSFPGRAVGNLRQPNHLASLLLWALAALVPLIETGALNDNRMRRALAAGAAVVLVFTLMLSGSRTGIVGLAFLTAWGAFDRSLSRTSRTLLVAAPLLYAASWWAVGLLPSEAVGTAVGAAQRIGQVDVTSGRFQVWREAIALANAHPWTGVGVGEFNLAWTLSAFPDRSPQLFDHSHNLIAQLLAELGWSLGLAVLGLLVAALVQAARRAWAPGLAQPVAYRAAFMMVLLMGLHSQLEYPLWYAHFLLPTAFAWGLCLGAGASPVRHSRWPLAAGVALVLGAGLMISEFRRVTAIFTPDPEIPLTERIADGQRSWLFAHHGDYARITALEEVAPPRPSDFARAKHYLLDSRLLIAWADAYARAGDVDRARWLAARLRELKQGAAQPYFAPCTDPAVADKPYQCTAPSKTFDWRDFK
jgi:O-antigen ligase